MLDPSLPPDRPLRLPRHVVDFERHALLSTDGLPVRLRPQALDVLMQLARRPGQMLPRDELLHRVWPGVVVTDDSLVQAISDLRRALGDDGPRLIQTVPRRGYRLVVPAPEAEPAIQHADSDAEEPASGFGTRPSGTRRMAAWITAGFVLAAVTFWASSHWLPAKAPVDPSSLAATPDRPPIAVLDFRDADSPTGSSPTQSEALARGFAEDLASQLARNADLRVIASFSSFAAAADRPPLVRIAEQLGARYLVDGSIRRSGDTLRLTVQLVDGRDGRLIWAEPHEMAAAEVFRTRDDIVRRIAGTLHSSMRTHQEALAVQRPPATLDVYEMTMRAIALKHRLTPETSREARALLERVVALDPNYAPGWLYLGFVNSLDNQNQLKEPFSLARMNEALAQLERSIALDGSLPAAHLALSMTQLPLGRHAEALASVRRCLELGPSDAECLMHYASLLVRVSGRPEQALPVAREAISSNPLAPSYVMHQYGMVLWANGDLVQALHWLDEAVRRAPGNLHARLTHLSALVEAGRLDDARQSFETLQARDATKLTAEAAAALTYAPAADALIQRRLSAFRRVGWPTAGAPLQK
jgi:TolB-like protein/DNA-binding winged helix-turn-helix (wHTH) protein/Tfp pilus assembly protein PilF